MRRGKRWISIALGLFFAGLGILGIFVPLLPTTVFLLIASALFVKASSRLHGGLLKNRLTGPYLRAYAEGAGLSRRRKAGAIVFLWIGLTISGILVRESSWALILLLAVGIGVTIHIATIKPRGPRRGPVAEAPDGDALRGVDLVPADVAAGHADEDRRRQ